MFRTIVMTTVLALSASAQAQPVHRAQEVREDRHERKQDKREIAKDKQEMRDDLRDLRALQGLSDEFNAARARGDARALRALDARLKRHLASELSESSRELRADQREVRRSEREVRDERREVRHDEREGRHGAQAADRRDLRDDRRDLKDDIRDAQKEQAALDRYHGLLRELGGLDGRVDPPALARKRVILDEMLARARGEIREDKKELREDKRELREDRHETREDRREHRH